MKDSQYYQQALGSRHYEVLREVIIHDSGYAPLGTERSQLLIDLFHAGYLSSERAVFCVTLAGRAALPQPH